MYLGSILIFLEICLDKSVQTSRKLNFLIAGALEFFAESTHCRECLQQLKHLHVVGPAVQKVAIVQERNPFASL